MAGSFELRGSRQMAGRMRRLAARFPDKVAGALRVEAEMVKTESARHYVPKDLGNLANSLTAHPVERRGADISAVISAGGSKAPYALAVHEFPSHSPRSWRGKSVGQIRSVRKRRPWTDSGKGRGPKFLERPLNEAAKGMGERIARAVTPTQGDVE